MPLSKVNFGDKKMTRKKAIWLCVVIAGLIILLFSTHNYDSMDGKQHLKIVDKKNIELRDILIIPLYSKSLGIGIGPFGMGPRTSASFVIKKPFTFNSGEDIMSKKVPSKGIIVAPFGKKSGLFGGVFKNNDIVRYALIKKGFAPALIKQDDIYGNSPIIMTSSDNKENAQIIKKLIAPQNDQDALKKIFVAYEIEEKINVSFDEQEVALLKSYAN
jgi:hypothetical protein